MRVVRKSKPCPYERFVYLAHAGTNERLLASKIGRSLEGVYGAYAPEFYVLCIVDVDCPERIMERKISDQYEDMTTEDIKEFWVLSNRWEKYKR